MAGFRIDVCNMIVKDAHLRDNPPALDTDPLDVRIFGQRPEFTSDRPEVHDVLRHWRRLADHYPDAVLLGETPVPTAEALAALLRRAATNSTWPSTSPSSPHPSRPTPCGPSSRRPRRPCRQGPGRCGPAPTTISAAWPPGGPAGIRPGRGWPSFMLLCLRGTPVLYQGDEIGLVDTEVAHEDMRDPLGVRY